MTLLLCLLALVASPTGIAQSQEKPKPAALYGRVTDAVTGKPVRMARLRLALDSRTERVEYRARTDDDGRYRVDDVRAGRYFITATKPRYVTLQYGQRLPAAVGRPVEVTAGAAQQADIALPRASAIVGRVTDEFGEPVERAVVTPMRVGYANGRRSFVPAGAGASTDDAGEYRIAGMPPGSYYIVVAERSSGFGSDGEADVGFMPTMYPAATKAEDARPLTLAPPQDATGIDISLSPGRTAVVAGVVTTSRGQPAAKVRLNLSVVDQPFGLGGETVTSADGRFSYPRVLPGRYELHVRKTGYSDRPGEEPEGAVVPIVVAGEDLTDLEIKLTRGGRLTGTVIPPDGSTATPKDVSLVALPIGDTAVTGVGFGQEPLKDDWTFEWAFLVAPRVVRTMRTPPGWYVSAVIRGAEDVTDTPTLFREPDEVRIVVAADSAQIAGTASGSDGRPSDDYTVVLFPEDSAKWNVWSRFIHTARPDQKGEFRLTAPPGDYLIAAVGTVEPLQWFNVEFLQRLKRVASPLVLQPNARATLPLKVVNP